MKNFFKKNRKILIVIFAVAVIFAVISVCVTPMAKAQSSGSQTPVKNTWNPISKIKDFLVGGLTNMLFQPVLKLLNVVAYGIFYLFGLLLSLAGALLDFVLTKPELNKFTSSPIVGFGWEQCRNLANMFFALILLVISFATILRIESYGIKQVLPRLIIAALLINFSLVIAGVIIDFTQVLTNYFVQQALAGTNGTSLSGTIANKLNVTEGILRTNQAAGTPPISDSIDGIIASIAGIFAGIIVILIATFTFFAAAIFLIIRYIALLFLLILAPLAWFFYIVPATRTYWNQWWSTFFKWAFFAPAYTFFLWISMQIIKSNVMQQVGPNGANVVAGTSSAFGRYSIPTLINYTIMIGFLLGSIIVAQKLGIYGAGAVVKMGKSAGRGFGRMAGRWAARGAPMPIVSSALRGANVITSRIPGLKKLDLAARAKKYEEGKKALADKIKQVPYAGAAFAAAAAVRKTLPSLFVPAVWKRAMASSRARAESASFSEAAGTLQGLLSLSITDAEIKKQQAHDAEVARKQDELNKNYQGDEDRLIGAWKSAKDPIEKEALIKLVANTNGLNTVLKQEGKEYTPGNLREFVKNTFGEKEGARIGATIGGIGIGNKNYSYVGMSKWNDKTQSYEFVKDDPVTGKTANEIQAEIAADKSLKQEPQDWARGIKADSFVKRDLNGKPTDKLTETGAEIIAGLTMNHKNQVQRLSTETLQVLHNAQADILAYASTLSAAQQNVANEFMKEVNVRYKP